MIFSVKHKEHEVAACPVCNNDGIINVIQPVYRNNVFKYEGQVVDCPVCESYGLIEVVPDKDVHSRTADNRPGDIHSW